MKKYHKIRILLAIKIEWLRPYLLTDTEKEKLSLLELRNCFKFFGFDTSDITDDQIKQGCDEFSKCLAKTRSTAQELIEVSNSFALLLA
ncbi:MAG: hypothetical protein H7296_07410 [Bacteroidia bacterium]|nr:hypothetical protein [Bacteroidia bacterium]